jgi:hypothetical protein
MEVKRRMAGMEGDSCSSLSTFMSCDEPIEKYNNLIQAKLAVEQSFQE